MLLTRDECTQILNSYALEQQRQQQQKQLTGLQLINYEEAPATQAIGYLGDYYVLTLSYSTAIECATKTQKFFVKTVPSKSDEPAKQLIFGKEALLYETLLKQLQQYSTVKWSPTCYYTRANELLVLEHMHLSGRYTSEAQPLGSLSDVRMRQTLRSLAALHAASFIYEIKAQVDIAQLYAADLQEITVAPHIAWYTTGLACIRAVIAAQPKYQMEECKNFLAKNFQAALNTIYDMTTASRHYRNVLCHRDTWACNIFFDLQCTADSSAVLVDYQTCRYCPPAVDVSFAIYMNLTSEDRRLKESVYIDWYYACLQRDMQHYGLAASDYLSSDELRSSYEEFRLFGAVYRAVAATIIRVPPAWVTNEYKYIERSAAVLERMENDKDFCMYMRECADEVMELASIVAKVS